MTHLAVTINGHDYKIACEDGQEDHLLKLSNVVEERVQELVSAVGQVGDARILVMACLVLADELHDIQADLSDLQSATGESGGEGEEKLASGIETLAQRVEAIASQLERT